MKKLLLIIPCFLFFTFSTFGQDQYVDFKEVICKCHIEGINSSDIDIFNQQYQRVINYLNMDSVSIKSEYQGWRERYEYDTYFKDVYALERKLSWGSQYRITYDKERIPTNYSTIRVPNSWVRTEAFMDKIIYKKPFDTYINESKNFDVMFGFLDKSTGFEWSPFLVVKNYMESAEYKSTSYITLNIGDISFNITESYSDFGRNFSEKELALRSGINVVAYRTVKIYKFPLERAISQKDKAEKTDYLNDLIKKAVPGKVSLVYETMTGKITRNFTEAQITSLKEMIKIYMYFLNKEEVSGWEYKNEQVKQECLDFEMIDNNSRDDLFNMSQKIDSLIEAKKIKLNYKGNVGQ